MKTAKRATYTKLLYATLLIMKILGHIIIHIVAKNIMFSYLSIMYWYGFSSHYEL